MPHLSAICVMIIVVCASQCRSQQTSSGLCTQLQQMHQLCVGQCGDTSQPAAEVDYDVIDSIIIDKVTEYTAQNEARISKLEADLTKLQNSLDHDCPTSGGLSTIYSGQQRKEIYCDMETDSGGWLVFQRRMDGSIDFYRNWDDYVKGFGNKTGEFWLGLDLLHELTSERDVELRIDLEDWEGNKRYAKYSTFKIGDASSVYKITVGGYTGDAGDSFSGTNRMKFTTKDRDSDTWHDNCAVSFKGAWWYKSCHKSNLNGFYFKGGVHESFADGVEWSTWKGQYYSMKFTEMKIRPIA